MVVPQGCTSSDSAGCSTARNAWDPATSSTWDEVGNFTLSAEENLGYSDNGMFGYDSLTLGVEGTNLPTLKKQLVAGIATKDFYVSSLGLRPAATNLTDLLHPIPSWIQALKTQQYITSLSWGYTAGAYWNNQGMYSCRVLVLLRNR